ncbi:MAG: cupin domain-containing protein [Hyphomicrobiaceae bacterium]|nr:cupin domain-containing protein [Hyphomicrobiaceae bacterium]
MRLFWIAILAAMMLAGPAMARGPEHQDYKRIEKIFSGSKTAIGETIHYPKGEPVDIESLIVTLKPGEETGWHKHGVPAFGYILSGEVTVDYGEKGKRTYKAGEGFVDAMNWLHNGMNEGAVPVRILVVFMGAKGSQDVIHKPRAP